MVCEKIRFNKVVLLIVLILWCVLACAEPAKATTLPQADEIEQLYDAAFEARAKGDHATGIKLMRRVVTAMSKKLGENHSELVGANLDLAYMHYSAGQFGSAASGYRKALEVIEKSGAENPRGRALAKKMLGMSLTKAGQHKEAIKFALEALNETRELHGLSSQTAIELSNVGNALLGTGQLEEAEKYFRESLLTRKILREDGKSISTASVENNLGELYRRRGKYGEARLYLMSALNSSQKDGNVPLLSTVLNNLGMLSRIQEDFASSEEFYSQSLKLLLETLPSDHPDIARTVSNLGRAKLGLGKYDESEKLYAHAFLIFHGNDPQHPSIANVVSLFGELHWKRKNYEKCEEYVRASLDMTLKQQGAESLEVAGLYHDLAMVMVKKNRVESGPLNDEDLKTVKGYLDRAIAITESKRGKDFVGLSVYHENAALIALTEGEAASAIPHFSRSQKIAVEQAWTVLPRLDESQSGKYYRYFWRRFQAALSAPLYSPKDNAVATASAQWLINNKGLLQEVLARQQQTLKSERSGLSPEQRLRLETINAQLGRLTIEFCQSKETKDLPNQLKTLAAEKNELVGQSTHKAEAARTPWIELEDVRKRLPPKSLLVEIAKVRLDPEQEHKLGASREKYLAWTISPEAGNNDVKFYDLGDAQLIDEQVRKFREKIAEDSNAFAELSKASVDIDVEKRTRDVKQISQQLSEKILWPLLRDNAGVERLILSPDSNLWLTPWAALVLPDGENYLIEKLQLQCVVSSRYLLEADRRQKRGSEPVVFADPKFGKKSTSETGIRGMLGYVNDLTHSEVEAHRIKDSIKKYCRTNSIELLLGEEANEAAAKKLENPHVLVFSTHGFFLQDQKLDLSSWESFQNELDRAITMQEFVNPLDRCGLILGGFNEKRDSQNPLDDGTLTGGEIATLPLENTDLVVLSACQTGVGDSVNGRGVASLRQAFQMAGARSVLATLWNVDDYETSNITNSFFRYLASGTDRFEALGQAQLDYINKQKEKVEPAHPAYWAPFLLTGY